jgi:hypothetical protein
MEDDLRFGTDGGMGRAAAAAAAAPKGSGMASAGLRRMAGAACLWRPPARHGLRRHRAG